LFGKFDYMTLHDASLAPKSVNSQQLAKSLFHHFPNKVHLSGFLQFLLRAAKRRATCIRLASTTRNRDMSPRIRMRFLPGGSFSMTASDNFLFADMLMDQKFRVTTEILEQFVSNPSQELPAARLAEYTGRSVREVNQVCRKLQLIGLVAPGKPAARGWKLVCDPNTITLEDVYRGVIAEAASVPEQQGTADPDRAADPARSVDLLIMQATMEVNQSIFRHLRQFSLGRPRNTHFSSSRR